jgi:hypothetical protein
MLPKDNTWKKYSKLTKTYDLVFIMKFLEILRKSGIVNMFGAGPFLYGGKKYIENEIKRFKDNSSFWSNSEDDEDEDYDSEKEEIYQELIDMADNIKDKMIQGATGSLKNQDDENFIRNVQRKIQKDATEILMVWSDLKGKVMKESFINEKKYSMKLNEDVDRIKEIMGINQQKNTNTQQLDESVFSDLLDKIKSSDTVQNIKKKFEDLFGFKFGKDEKNDKDIANKGGESIIIGDSTVPYLDNAITKANRISETPGEDSLWEGGKTVIWLNNAVKKYDVDESIGNVIISIGTNDLYKDYGVKELVSNIKTKFPNAKLMVVQGTYGNKIPCSSAGYCALSKTKQSTVDDYYKKFKNEGVTVIEPAIGNVKDCHGNLPIYKEIASEIDSKL